MKPRTKVLLAFSAGVLTAAAVNNLRWSIWPISGGPYVGGPNGPQLFGWLGGPPRS